MKLLNRNPIAAAALWNALVNLADNKYDQITNGKGLEPYSVVVAAGDDAQQVVIVGNNAAYRVNRYTDDKGVVEYRVNRGGDMYDAVHEACGWNKREELDADRYLTGLIDYVSRFRTPDGSELRHELAQREVSHRRHKATKNAFSGLMASAESKVLTAHDFYKADIDIPDLQQLQDTALTNVAPGMYVYASFEGQGVLDTLVFVSKTRHNVVLFRLEDHKIKLYTRHDILAKLIHQTQMPIAAVMAGLGDPTSFASEALDAPMQPVEATESEGPFTFLREILTGMESSLTPSGRLCLCGKCA